MFIFTLVLFVLALAMVISHIIEYIHYKPDLNSYLDLDDHAKWGDFAMIVLYLVIAYMAFIAL